MKTSTIAVLAGWAMVSGLSGCSSDDGDGASAAGGAGGAANAAGGQSSSADDPAGPIYSGGCDAIPLEPPELGLQFEMPLSVPAGEEREYCQLVIAEQDVNLNWADGLFTTGSHHALVHRTSYKDALPTTTIDGSTFDGDPGQPHPCLTASALWDVQGIVAGGRNVELRHEPDTTTGGTLPDNVAMRIEKGDVLVVNFHMINTHSEPVDSCYKVNLNGIDDAAVEHEAGIFFLYDPFITVPAGSQASSRRACEITEDVTLLSAVSHMHARGVGSSAFLYDGSPAETDAQQMQQFYDIPEWEEPDMIVFDEPVPLQAGEWIDWRCQYDNTEQRNVAQGFASTDEMCMFIGTYYPRVEEMEQCGDQGSLGVSFGSGNMNGQQFVDCIFASTFTFTGAFDDPDRYQTLGCFTDTCPEVTPLTFPFLQCLGANGGPTGCETEMAAVQAATCGG